MADKAIKISMRGFAEVASAASKRKSSTLKKFKFPESEESVGRSNYYIKALSAIKHHHRGDHRYVRDLLQELASEISTEQDARKRAKLAHNHRAVTQYIKQFGARKLLIKPGKQLHYVYKNVVVSARPDLVAEDGGSLFLIKLNLGKEDYKGGVNPIMLHMLYEAAATAGMSVKPNCVECLQVASGSRVAGPKSGFAKKQVLDVACEELLALWPAA